MIYLHKSKKSYLLSHSEDIKDGAVRIAYIHPFQSNEMGIFTKGFYGFERSYDNIEVKIDNNIFFYHNNNLLIKRNFTYTLISLKNKRIYYEIKIDRFFNEIKEESIRSGNNQIVKLNFQR